MVFKNTSVCCLQEFSFPAGAKLFWSIFRLCESGFGCLYLSVLVYYVFSKYTVVLGVIHPSTDTQSPPGASDHTDVHVFGLGLWRESCEPCYVIMEEICHLDSV